MNTGIQLGKAPFRDMSKFPRGFSRSGDFSIAEARLLTLYGQRLLALEEQPDMASNQEEQDFVQFAAGDKQAQSPIEKVWQKYQRLARGRRNFYPLNGARRSDSIDADSIEELELEI